MRLAIVAIVIFALAALAIYMLYKKAQLAIDTKRANKLADEERTRKIIADYNSRPEREWTNEFNPDRDRTDS